MGAEPLVFFHFSSILFPSIIYLLVVTTESICTKFEEVYMYVNTIRWNYEFKFVFLQNGNRNNGNENLRDTKIHINIYI